MTLQRLRPLAATLGWNAPLWAALLPAVVFVAAALQLGLAPVDPDYWWHLSAGRWMLDHGRIPFTDPFSVSHGGQNWYAHEWLAELLLAVSHRLGGYTADILLTALIVAAGGWLLGRAARGYGAYAFEALLLVGGSGFFILGNLAVRPQVWGWALFALLLHELAANDTGRRPRLWHTALIFALWINIHLSALVGGGAFALYVLHRALRWLAARGSARACLRAQFRHVFSAAAVSALALCLNPRGPALIWFTRVYANQSAVRYRYIGEWQRPSFSGNDRWLFVAAGAIVLLAAGAMLWQRRLWPGVLALLFAAAALRAVRYVPLFALVSVPALGWVAARCWRRPPALRPLRVRPLAYAALASLAVVAVWIGAWAGGPSQFRREADPRPGGYPVDAAAYVKANLPETSILGEYGWGGYIISVFYPERRVYIDGREEMYGERFFDRFVRTMAAEPGWQQTLADANIGATVIAAQSALAAAMDGDPGWRRVYSDAIAAVFVPARTATGARSVSQRGGGGARGFR